MFQWACLLLKVNTHSVDIYSMSGFGIPLLNVMFYLGTLFTNGGLDKMGHNGVKQQQVMMSSGS